jgi:hypothetical protein
MYHDNSTCDGCDDQNIMCISVDDRLLCADCCRINEELETEFEDGDDYGNLTHNTKTVYNDDGRETDYEDDIYEDDRYDMSDAYDEW